MSKARSLHFWPAWRFMALLGFALLAPASLPAGGCEQRLPELRRRENQREPLLSDGCQPLRAAPRQQAPVLASLETGVPMRVLRQWLAPNGSRWLQVETSTGRRGPSRGWLAG